MTLSQRRDWDWQRVRDHWLFRYGLAVALAAATIGLSVLLRRYDIRVNLTIPVLLALVAGAWYGGRGPGLLMGILFQATTIYYVPIPPDSSLPRIIFSWFSIFTLYVFVVLVISGVKRIQRRLAEQRDLLQVTLSSIGDAVITTDTKGVVTFMNPAAEQLTGWETSEALGAPLEDVFDIIHEESRERVSNPVSRVLDTGTVVGLANHSVLRSRSGREIPIDDSAAPIKDRDKIKGVVLVFANVTSRKAAERSQRESEIMYRIIEAQEAERQRIARDLHDHLGQKMTALRLRIEALSAPSAGDPALGNAITELQRSASHIDRDIGFLSWELRPTELEDLGLVDALRSFVREWSSQYGISAEFHTNIEEDLDDGSRLLEGVETNLYRIVQEALNNVLKHADAKNVNVLLHQLDGHLVLIIEDDGLGFELDGMGNGGKPARLGLIGMRERAAILNGTLEIDTKPGQGTTILARIPLQRIEKE